MTLGELLIKVGVDTSELQTLDSQIAGPIGKAGERIERTGSSMTRGMSAPLGLFAALAIRTAGDFEYAMNKVQVLTEATGTDFERLNDQAKMLGATTAFSASDAAEAMGFLAQAGFNTEQIIGTMPNALNLAASAQLDMGRATDILANIMSGFQLSTADSRRAVDVLAQSAAAANTDLTDLGEAFKYAGPIAAGLGLEFEETAALLSLFSNAGIKASSAGTGLRQGLAYLIRPSKDGAAALERLGISTVDVAGDLRNVPDILLEMANAGARTGDIIDIFGIRSSAAFQSVIADIQRDPATVQTFLNGLATSGEGAGRAADIAAAQMRGLNGAMFALSSAAEAVVIAIGDSGVLDGLTKVVTAASEVTQNLTQTNPMLLRFAAAFTGILIAAGPVVFIVGKLMTFIGPLSAAFSLATAAGGGLTAGLGAVWAALSPILPIVLGVALAVAVLYTNWERITAFFNGPGRSAVEGAMQVYESLKGVVGAVMENVQAQVMLVLGIIAALWEEYGGYIMDVVSAVFSAIVPLITGALDIITNALKFFTAAFKGDWRGMFEAVKGIGYAAARAVIGLITGLFDGIAAIQQRALDGFRGALVAFAQSVRSSGIPGAEFIASMAGGLVTAIDAVSARLYSVRGAVQAFGDASRFLGRSGPMNVAPDRSGAADAGAPPPPRPPEAPELPAAPPGAGGDADDDDDDAETDAEKKAKRIADLFNGLNDRIAAAVAAASAFGTPLDGVEARAQELQTTFTALAKEGIAPADARMQSMVTRFQAATTEAKELRRSMELQTVLTDLQTGLSNAALRAQVLPGTFNLAAEGIDLMTSALGQGLALGLDPMGEKALELVDQIEKLRVQAEVTDRALQLTEARKAFEEAGRLSVQWMMLTGDYGEQMTSQVSAVRAQLEAMVPALGANAEEVKALYAELERLERVEAITGLVEGAFRDLGNTFLDFSTDAVTGLFEMITGAESSVGSIGDLAKGLLSSVLDTLGNLLIQVGQTAIGTGLGIKAIVQALKSLNPYVAIAAGVALVALGAAVKASLGSAAGGGGGGGGGGGYAVGGTYGGSGMSQAAMSGASGDPQQKVVAELRGLRGDVRDLANRPVEFTGDPREFRRAQGAADAQARRTDVTG